MITSHSNSVQTSDIFVCHQKARPHYKTQHVVMATYTAGFPHDFSNETGGGWELSPWKEP